jgi:hypothetical protein
MFDFRRYNHLHTVLGVILGLLLFSASSLTAVSNPDRIAPAKEFGWLGVSIQDISEGI